MLHFKSAISFSGYLLCAGLMAFYLFTLYSAFRPAVCEEYQLYYIDKELQDWPGYGGLSYLPGTPLYFDSLHPRKERARRLGKGWNSPEENGTWTYGDRAVLFFTDLPVNSMNLDLLVTDLREGASGTVYFDGSSIGKIDAAGNLSFPLSVKADSDSLSVIEIKVENFGAIGEDSRNQGIKIMEVQLNVEE